MSLRATGLGLLLGIAWSAVPAVEPESQRPLRPMSACFDPDRARSWHLIDSDEVLVDAGRRRFHLQLSFACPELSYHQAVGFVSGNGVGRICGSPGDMIATTQPGRRRTRCAITTVTPLDAEQYRAYFQATPEGVVETREPAQTPAPESKP